MKAHIRQQAIDLRLKDQASYTTIRKKLGVSKSTLSHWLQEFPLTKERILELRKKGWQNGEAGREQFRATMRARKEQKTKELYNYYLIYFDKISKDTIFAAGLMLYLAEGDKKNANRLVLANTDPAILRFFVQWVMKFFSIARDDMKVQLHLYDNMDLGKEKQYWSRMLSLPVQQFYKPTIRKVQQSGFSYIGPNRHGTCSIFIADTEKKRTVMAAIQAFLDKASERV